MIKKVIGNCLLFSNKTYINLLTVAKPIKRRWRGTDMRDGSGEPSIQPACRENQNTSEKAGR